MTISQIDTLLSKNLEDINNLHKQLRLLNEKSSQLYRSKEDRLHELFIDYIQIGSKYDINRYMSLSGVHTGIKKGDQQFSPSFSKGDVIEFTKKNKKSIVITCLTKVMSKLDRTTGVRTSEIIKPNWTFRIDTNNLYHELVRDIQFKQGFESYVRRTEALDLLLV
jgi:hypothetical protein